MSTDPYIVRAGEDGDMGAKARGLAELARIATVPVWFVVTPRAHTDGVDLAKLPAFTCALAELARTGERFAVRSSAREEDGANAAFAGQFESYLGVAAEDVPARIQDVWRSAALERVGAYRAARSLDGDGSVPAVIVQCMVNADRAGVAFSADPVSGRRDIAVIAATVGLGSALVSGDENADTFRVDWAGNIIERRIADKRVAHRAAGNEVRDVTLPDAERRAPALTDAQVREVAACARAAARASGTPQDIEWAIADGVLYALQSRPITSLDALPDAGAPLVVWDNSNIAESYGGVTTPLTFSFARTAYEEVYREFCRLVGIPQDRIAANAGAFRSMLGLVRGRIYYNLAAWYQTLALLPGFAINREFMEQMMGVREPLPDEIVQRAVAASRRGRLRDAMGAAWTIAVLLVRYARIDATVRGFHARVEHALTSPAPLAEMRPDELTAHYDRLKTELLYRWDAPLVNDFFAMIFFGALGRLCERWCGDVALQNELVSGQAVVSTEPVMRMRAMARAAAGDAGLVTALATAPVDDAVRAIRTRPTIAALYDDYLRTFGDRCAGELKLETETLAERPEPLLRAVGALARDGAHDAQYDATSDERAAAAEAVALARIGSRPDRRMLFRFVLRHARRRVRDRENLRFERTRVFGRVRRIMVELGHRFASCGLLDEPRDVFYLTLDEVLGAGNATAASADFRALVEARVREFARYADEAPPPDRFATRGLVTGAVLRVEHASPSSSAAASLTTDDARTGTPCFPGVVRGTAHVVRDPARAVLAPGEILVAERTDPGWVILFPSAAALVVERGSLLSHSAIVARELRLPAVVAVDGLTHWLESGDLIEIDGGTGTIRRLERATHAEHE